MNRIDLIAKARAQLKLTDIPPADWSYQQRTEYNKLLAALITANADTLPPQEVEIARKVVEKIYDPLSDNSALDDLKTFGDSFAGELLATADAVADVGRGVRDSVSFVGKALPYTVAIALVLVATYFVIKYDPRRK